jgi:chromosomal replication initiation ATPase DnaA
MTSPPRQLTLEWPHNASFAREDFLAAASNREALAAVDHWPAWAGRLLLLVGPEGAGKSHLAALWAEKAGAVVFHGESLSDANVEACAQAPAWLIEDADRIGQAEELLFHLINRALQGDAWLLVTARSAPDAWELKVPDLLSRLRLAPVVRLDTPDVELTEAVLFKLFSDRQLEVEPHVVSYIAIRIDRSLGAARKFVAILDGEALARGRRVTRVMAGELLREIAASDETP